MVWIFIAIGTVGLVMLVPVVLRAIDLQPPEHVAGFVGFAGTAFGVCGPLMSRFTVGWAEAFIAATAVGLATGVAHPEILAALRRKYGASNAHEPINANEDAHEAI